MIHPSTEVRFIDENIGLGVFATSFIPKGTIVWVQDPLDHVLSPDEIKKLPEPLMRIVMKYTFRNPQGQYVLCWDSTRFVNHSFAPNVMITPYDFDIAIQDIPVGSELRGDYGCLNIIESFEPDPEPGCARKVVQPDDLLHHHKAWDVILGKAFPALKTVDQPLRSLFNSDKWDRMCRIAQGEEKLDSVLKCYYSGAKNTVK
jgi:uncharacterized protein